VNGSAGKKLVAETKYQFVVENSAGQAVGIDFREHDDAAKQQYVGVWHKLAQAVQKHHQLTRSAVPGWTTWKPGEWCDQQRGYEQRQKVVAWCGANLVGFLNVWPGFGAIHSPGKSVLYVEHMGAAPGNLTTELWLPRFQRVGGALLAYAIWLSGQRGYDGRLGLHVADEQALGFYQHVNKTYCGGALFHPERTGVPGPTPRGKHDEAKAYLETTELGAAQWLKEYEP
jgi:hypothetical protein